MATKCWNWTLNKVEDIAFQTWKPGKQVGLVCGEDHMEKVCTKLVEAVQKEINIWVGFGIRIIK